MRIRLYGHTVEGGLICETSPETVDTDLENLVKLFQGDGYYVIKTAPQMFDVSRRSGDRLTLAGILAVEH